jgi:hypothetical protein
MLEDKAIHQVLTWDVSDREEAQIAADLVSRACLRERINKGSPPQKPAKGAGGAEILVQVKGEQ